MSSNLPDLLNDEIKLKNILGQIYRRLEKKEQNEFLKEFENRGIEYFKNLEINPKLLYITLLEIVEEKNYLKEKEENLDVLQKETDIE